MFETNQQPAEAVVPAAPAQDNVQQQENAPEQQIGEQGDSQQAQDSQQPKEEQRDELSPRARKAINRATAEKYEARAEAKLLREQVEALKRQQVPGAENTGSDDPIETAKKFVEQEREKDRVSAQLADIAEQSNEVFKKGLKADPKFADKVGLVNVYAPLFDDRGLTTTVGEAVLGADEPHLVLSFLADNPDVAEEIAGLKPVQAGKRVARIEADLRDKSRKQISSAPKPLEPVKGSTKGSGEPDPKDTEAYIKWRRAQRFKG